jgi:hypothetical protein
MNFAPDSSRVFIFRVVTDFEIKVRRPGGLPRDQALRNARIRVQRLSSGSNKPAAKAVSSGRTPRSAN